MLTAAQRSISCTCFFFFSFFLLSYLLAIADHVSLFRPTKTAKHFSPLSCVLVQLHMSPDVGDTPETSLPRFFPKSIFLSLQTYFFRSLSSICFPLPFPFSKGAKKAQTTTFLIKFLRCFFPSTTYFYLLAFLGLKGFPF